MSLMDALENAWTKRMEMMMSMIKTDKMMFPLLLGTQKSKTLVLLENLLNEKLVCFFCVFLLMRKNVSGRIYSSATLMNRLHDYYYSTLPYSIFLPFIIHGFRWFRTKKPLIIIIASSSCEVKESSFSCHTYMHSTLACSAILSSP